MVQVINNESVFARNRTHSRSSVDETSLASVTKIHRGPASGLMSPFWPGCIHHQRRYSPLMRCLPAQIYSSPPSEINSWTRGPYRHQPSVWHAGKGKMEVTANITLVNNLEFISIFYSSDAMRCICSHRHNPDTPRHTRRHPNIDTEPKTDTLWLCLMSEGGEGATRAWLKGGVKGGREGGRQLPVPSAGDAPSLSKAALPPQQSTGHSFFSREAKRRKMGNL